MRILLALMIAVPLLAASLEADAGLVEDLRSGKSDVRAALEGYSRSDAYYRKFIRERKSARDYKVFVTWREWIYYRHGYNSAEEAVESIMQECERKNRPCKIYAVGNTVVLNYSQAELADAIEAYQLEVSGSKADGTLYCKSSFGKVYDIPYNNWYGKSHVCPSSHTQITKAEYDRLKGKKTDTATTSKTETESSNDDPLEAKLEKLKKLLEKGLITEEEAAAKRAKLLEDL